MVDEATDVGTLVKAREQWQELWNNYSRMVSPNIRLRMLNDTITKGLEKFARSSAASSPACECPVVNPFYDCPQPNPWIFEEGTYPFHCDCPAPVRCECPVPPPVTPCSFPSPPPCNCPRFVPVAPPSTPVIGSPAGRSILPWYSSSGTTHSCDCSRVELSFLPTNWPLWLIFAAVGNFCILVLVTALAVHYFRKFRKFRTQVLQMQMNSNCYASLLRYKRQNSPVAPLPRPMPFQ